MRTIRIRKMREEDIPTLVDIWYETSIQAHSFISTEYWATNKLLMKEKYLPMSETYIAEQEQKPVGFISLIEEYIAAIFVKPEAQGHNIGTTLLNYVKDSRQNLYLKVYSKNTKSIEFYKKNNFSVISESPDENTSEKELLMEWLK